MQNILYGTEKRTARTSLQMKFLSLMKIIPFKINIGYIGEGYPK
jgi:hypothetical protein